MSSIHEFDIDKWQSMSIFDQMGNIGSEVGRASNAWRTGDVNAWRGALMRGLDLLDATIDGLAKTKSPRIREVLLAREQFTAQYFADTKVIDPGIENYFMQFAIAARLTATT